MHVSINYALKIKIVALINIKYYCKDEIKQIFAGETFWCYDKLRVAEDGTSYWDSGEVRTISSLYKYCALESHQNMSLFCVDEAISISAGIRFAAILEIFHYWPPG